MAEREGVEPDSGSPSEEQEDRVPLSRAERMAENAARRAAQEANARWEAKFSELREQVAQPKQAETREYSRDQLQAAVDNGTISQEQMDDVLERQREARTERRITQRVEAQARESRLLGEIDRYKSLRPEVADKTSDLGSRVSAEVRALEDRLGVAQDRAGALALEAAALRAVLGPAEQLQAPRVQGHSHEEVDTGGGGDDEPSGEARDGYPKGLSEREKAHYQKMVSSGVYTLEQVKKEVARKRERQKARAA